MPQFDRDLIAKRIKSIRIQQNLSQEKFGQLFTPPVNKSVVSRWESGGSLPSEENLITLANIANVTIDSIYRTDKFQSQFSGRNLKMKRKALDLSKKDLAKLVDLTKDDIKAIEAGESDPDDELLHRFHDELVTNLNDFKSDKKLSQEDITGRLNRIEEKLNYIIEHL